MFTDVKSARRYFAGAPRNVSRAAKRYDQPCEPPTHAMRSDVFEFSWTERARNLPGSLKPRKVGSGQVRTADRILNAMR